MSSDGPSSVAPSVAPPAPLTATQAALPTFGALVGTALGKLIAAKLGFTDPLVVDTITTLTAGVVTGAFHWLGTKFGAITL
jgi:hypothetical protein